MATYPHTQETTMMYSFKATTVVSLINEIQTANVAISDNGILLGMIRLDPMQPVAVNIDYQLGQQTLKIAEISFVPASTYTMGQIICDCVGTDTNGQNPEAFRATICNWSD